MPSITSVAAWVSRFAKLRSVRKNGLRNDEQDAEHDEAADGGQRAHLAAADALEPCAHLVADAALLAAADEVAPIAVAEVVGRERPAGSSCVLMRCSLLRVLVPVM